MNIKINEHSLCCNCGIEFRPLIRTYRNIYMVCTCGKMKMVKRRLWFVHYTRSVKGFCSSKLINCFNILSNREDHRKKNEVLIL
jgi:hypothetical protein